MNEEIEERKLIATVLAIDVYINVGGGITISQEMRGLGDDVMISMEPRHARLVARRLVELAREIERSHV